MKVHTDPVSRKEQKDFYGNTKNVQFSFQLLLKCSDQGCSDPRKICGSGSGYFSKNFTVLDPDLKRIRPISKD